MGITSATLAIIFFTIFKITNYHGKHDIILLTLLDYKVLNDMCPLSK